jgi:hypothetical protein
MVDAGRIIHPLGRYAGCWSLFSPLQGPCVSGIFPLYGSAGAPQGKMCKLDWRSAEPREKGDWSLGVGQLLSARANA